MIRKALGKRREIFLFVISAALIITGSAVVWAASLKIPDIESIQERKIEQTTKIYDRTGTILLDDLSEDITRTVVPISEISKHIQTATIAIEDAEFYTHHGVRITSTIRAILANLVPGGYTQGGSTITQQVVKNSILTTDQTIARKVKEWVLSVKLEQVLTKEKILELYLNESPYGGSIYGIEEASQKFFGKHAKDIGLAEAAYLAAIPQAPTYYSPYGNHREDLEHRKNIVLSRMRELGSITESEYDRARNEVVVFAPQQVSGIRAPHFVFFVREQLEKEFGGSVLEQSGWRIITTLDAHMQDDAEQTLTDFSESNERDFNASNAALVALDPLNGDILAMMGSRDYFDEEIDGNYNVATARPGRQPGSAFKPFVYAQAFREGYTPDTVLFDVPTQFSTECALDTLNNEPPCYAPSNYDEKYRGPMTIRNALAQSINIPAVKTLYLVGIKDALRLANALGITTLADSDRYGLTLVLGGGEVTPLEMASSYGVFAAEGVYAPPRAVLRIEGRDGSVVKTYDTHQEQVLEQNVALQISDILSDEQAKIPAYGVGSPIFFPGYHVASKTGTTNDTRDAWVIGYTPSLVVATWAGNNDNTPMEKKVAGLIVVPMWHDFFAKALDRRGDEPFPEYRDTVTEADKSVLRGIWQGGDVTRVDAHTLQPVPDDFMGSTRNKIVTNVHSILYWLDKDAPREGRPQYPEDDAQYGRWEWAVRKWASDNQYSDGAIIYQ